MVIFSEFFQQAYFCRLLRSAYRSLSRAGPNALRYPETQICPPNIIEWEKIYIQKLEVENCVNAKRMGTEAIWLIHQPEGRGIDPRGARLVFSF